MVYSTSCNVAGKEIAFETGRLAKQAAGAVLVRSGETMVLVTAVAEKKGREGIDFFPLTVDYLEMTYAAGKIPGGYFKREGRPTEKEILTSRFIDRPIRPLFPKGFTAETQIIATVLSSDGEHDSDMLGINGASAALHLSDIPFDGPIGAVRVGRVEGNLILNPSTLEDTYSDLNLIVVGSRKGIVMVEGGSDKVDEEVILEAIFKAHDEILKIVEAQEKLRELAGKPKRKVEPPVQDLELIQKIKSEWGERIETAVAIPKKLERHEALGQIYDEILAAVEDGDIRRREILGYLEKIEGQYVRNMILDKGVRIGGRSFKDVRDITCEVGVLPRTHGSALFTRGETQALVIVTLGTSSDEQKVEALDGASYKSFMLHYKFPPFSVGEVKFLRGPSRREVGHGALAERAVQYLLPNDEDFPYTIRVVSEILESNGSSSMATVCGSSLSLMDAGVPMLDPVAGIAMGLLKGDDKVVILSDIIGDEDHHGDMDFKVAGSREGITALQMDIKIDGITREVLTEALYQAREGRIHILGEMAKAIEAPRSEISDYAPRIYIMYVNPEKIRDIIGPGGKIIRAIQEETGTKIEVDDTGKVVIASVDGQGALDAKKAIQEITQEAELGRIYMGTVRKITDFGAFVEIFPGTDGLVHISQLAPERVRKVSDVVNEGDSFPVKVIGIDAQGKIKLSRKDAIGQSPDI
ncbi:MAG: polyribonucleotide nucleotidyltransferase [Desulfomonile tiedjei]|uniref:Polyribonucleotide nucleotidyltransferase n=1 Tax=Desulfomonile tiedjei TaxID=2358 RepID=A0A9D6YZU0_9BACT|nr:polyribonucleotide nucleotidyltransferase [Desulfomonile tiedjei]